MKSKLSAQQGVCAGFVGCDVCEKPSPPAPLPKGEGSKPSEMALSYWMNSEFYEY